MKPFKYYFFGIVGISVSSLNAQDKGRFQLVKPGYYQNVIMRAVEEESTEKPEPSYRFKIDLSGRQNLVTDLKAYTQVWHLKPISQGNTGTCWCFATTSFYESEIKRLTGQEIDLSEAWSVYWEYVERARYFVEKRGQMFLGEGSETNALARLYRKYGVVPAEAYTGLVPGRKIHSHAKLFAEFESFLKHVKEAGLWDTAVVVHTVRQILDHHMGRPPIQVNWKGKTYSPLQFMKEVARINPDDYVDIMSLMSIPYYTRGEYKVPDNWWHDASYYNVPLDVFLESLKNAIRKGYSIALGGDVSEAGLDTDLQVAVVPSFDIPATHIDENARYFRFANGSTTDDHAMHVVGYSTGPDGAFWFLLKDSGSGSRNCGEQCPQFGYYFMHEDYVKLKMMTATLHKDAVKDVLSRFQKL
ncbi:MAG: C1 family peptidase [Flavobacteriales bacterium]|nr:C1 family peptidase [Flavobacteriales bacterium]MCX7767497.1 C1 family peptidase [Flavobacteriales bacterium]MDW8409632.1 C1 family peptidase [Flavobacteriales bacterium]